MLWNRISKLTVKMFGDSPLVAKITNGGAWLGGGGLAEQSVRFLRNIVLARLIAPEAFGEMAIVLSVSSLIHTMTDLGLRESVIQNPRGSEESYINAAWWLAFGRSLSLYAALFLAAPFVAIFYHNAQLGGLLRLATAGIVFDGAASARSIVAAKALDLKRVAMVNHGGGICAVLVTVVLSLLMRNVWALAIGTCAESVMRCVLSYWIWPHLPTIRWDLLAFRDLLKFSRGVFGLAFLNLIFARADVAILAKMFSATEVGLYTLAVNLIQTPVVFAMNLLGSTLLPAFSGVQDDDKRMNRMLIRVSSIILLFGLPAIVSICLAGRPLLMLAYGQKYQAASGALIVASIAALINLLNAQITIVFYAKGRPKLHRGSVAIMAACVIALVYPSIKLLGIVGAQVACLIAVIMGYLYQAIRVRLLTGLSVRVDSRSLNYWLLPPLCVTAVYLCGHRLLAMSGPVAEISLCVSGFLTAFGVCIGILLRRSSQHADKHSTANI